MCYERYDSDVGYCDVVECSDAAEARDQLFNAQRWLKHVLTAVYETGDLEILNDSLQELCGHLDVNFPNKSILLILKEAA